MKGRDRILRIALGISAPVNLLAAFVFAFPTTAPGRLLELPPDVPPIYRGLVALFVALFGGVYAWLSLVRAIPRPLVGLSAIGKSLAFFTLILLWLTNLGPAGVAFASFGDALLAGIYTWWLFAE